MKQEISRTINQKGFVSTTLLVLLLVLVTVLSSVGTYLFLNSQTRPQPISQPTPTEIPATPSPTIDPTADWKTYTNKEQGVEFRYPSSWYLVELHDVTFSVFLNETPIKYLGGSDTPLGSISVGLNECTNTVTNEKYPCTKSVTESVSNLNSILSRDSLTVKDLTVAGRVAKQVSGTIAPNQPREGSYIKQTFIPLTDYQIVATLERKNLEKIYDHILPTFKFLDQNKTDRKAKVRSEAVSPDGLNKLFIEISGQGDSFIRELKVSDVSGIGERVLLSKAGIDATDWYDITIKNWSPDDKNVFLVEGSPSGSDIYVFKLDTPTGGLEKYLKASESGYNKSSETIYNVSWVSKDQIHFTSKFEHAIPKEPMDYIFDIEKKLVKEKLT